MNLTIRVSGTRTVREHSVEAVGGNKQVEAMNLTLIGGARTDLASLGNVNTTAGAHMTTTTGKTRTDTTGGDFSEDVGGKRTANVAGSVAETIGRGKSSAITGDEKTDVSGESTETIGGAKTITAAQVTINSSSTIGFKAGKESGGTSVFGEFLGFCDEVLAALDVLASHDHPDAGTITQGGSVSGHRAAAGTHREKLGAITT